MMLAHGLTSGSSCFTIAHVIDNEVFLIDSWSGDIANNVYVLSLSANHACCSDLS